MRISTRGRYALRMLIDLAEHQSEGYVSLNDIAKRQDISKKYLEQIVPLLNREGILKTNRGFQGGYMLAQPPEKYTIGDILRLTEGSLVPVAPSDSPYSGGEEYVLLSIWQELDRIINAYLDSVTLQDILERLRQQYGNDYVI